MTVYSERALLDVWYIVTEKVAKHEVLTREELRILEVCAVGLQREATANTRRKASPREPVIGGGLSIDHLEISVRAHNALQAVGLTTVEAVRAKTDGELLRIPNFGRISLNELKLALASLCSEQAGEEPPAHLNGPPA